MGAKRETDNKKFRFALREKGKQLFFRAVLGAVPYGHRKRNADGAIRHSAPDPHGSNINRDYVHKS
jgi:hypothetical protein